ncbi:MAG: hypothetical protein FWH38_10305 [Treponema sp.]|nr:hypothetical protein [Treponema sp.]
MSKKSIFWVITIAVIVSVAFFGCSRSGGNSGKELKGTWEGDYGMTWTFTGNKVTYEIMGMKYTVPYKVKGSAIVMEYMGAEAEFDYEIESEDGDDYLIFNIMGMEMEFIRVK